LKYFEDADISVYSFFEGVTEPRGIMGNIRDYDIGKSHDVENQQECWAKCKGTNGCNFVATRKMDVRASSRYQCYLKNIFSNSEFPDA